MTTALLEAPTVTSGERLLTRAQVAERLGVSERTVDRLADRGELPRQRIVGTRLVRFSEADVRALLDQRAR